MARIKEKSITEVLKCKITINGKRVACASCPHNKGMITVDGRVIVKCDGGK